MNATNNKEHDMNKPDTINVRTWNTTAPACCGADGTVRVWDSVAGHYTTCHRLTAGQLRYVRSRVRWGAVCA